MKDGIDLHIYEQHQRKTNTIRMTSQNPEYVQTHCNNRHNPLNFTIRK